MPINRSLARKGAAASCAALSLAAVGPFAASIAQGAGTKTVHIKNIDFSPHVLKVAKGTTVRWTFEDKATPHNVTSRGSKKFKSSHSMQSGTYSVRFGKAGTYRYVCTIHFNMKGSIVVH